MACAQDRENQHCQNACAVFPTAAVKVNRLALKRVGKRTVNRFTHLRRREHVRHGAVESQRIAGDITANHFGACGGLGVFDADFLQVKKGNVQVFHAGNGDVGLRLALPSAAHVDDARDAQLGEEKRLVFGGCLVQRCSAEKEARCDSTATLNGDSTQIAHVANFLKRNGSQSRSFPNENETKQRFILSQAPVRPA